MVYSVKGLARPPYYGVMYGGERCEPFEIFVDAENKSYAREGVRRIINNHYSRLASVQTITEAPDKEASMVQNLALPDLEKPWWESKISAYDIESTGLSPSGDRIVEIGFSEYDIDEKKFTNASSYFINDGKPISDGAFATHGITPEMISDAPTFEELFDEIYEKHIKDRAFLISHNRGFDHSMLLASMARSERKDYIPPVICTMELGINSKGGPKKNKLDVLMEHYGVEGVNSHRAGDDAAGCGNLFLAFARQSGSYFRQVNCTANDVIIYFDELKWPGDYIYEDAYMGLGNHRF